MRNDAKATTTENVLILAWLRQHSECGVIAAFVFAFVFVFEESQYHPRVHVPIRARAKQKKRFTLGVKRTKESNLNDGQMDHHPEDEPTEDNSYDRQHKNTWLH